MSGLSEFLVVALIVIGSAFVLVGSFGLIRLPDLMSRLHAQSKATTLGIGGCLAASMVYFLSTRGHFSIQEMLITFFLFITAPVTAHFIAKAHLHLSPKTGEDLPQTGRPLGWSTYEADTSQSISRAMLGQSFDQSDDASSSPSPSSTQQVAAEPKQSIT